MDPMQQIIIGIDIHKYSHTAVGINIVGEEIFHKDFTNENINTVIQKLQMYKKDTVIIGLEDINGYGKKLNSVLITEGYKVYHIPAVMTERERRKTTHRAKSDYLDAKGVAKATLLSHRALPQSILTYEMKRSEELRMLVEDREDLVTRQTELKNQIHILLHQLKGDQYKKKIKNIFSEKMIKIYLNELKDKASALEKRCLRKMNELKYIKDCIKEIDNELKDISKDNKQVTALKELVGCGELTACKILGEIKDINKFQTEGKLARYAGLAPREHSSSRSLRMYTDRAGNRRLNRAIHTIALSQIGNRGREESKIYYEKKKREGKSKLHSLRCLKRQLVREIYRKLKEIS